MKILLISDVHSNLLALEEVLNRATYDEILFLGDVVDYGPQPKEVFDVLQYLKARRVLGNHDFPASSGSDCRSSARFHEASSVTRSRITLKAMSRKALDALGKADKKLNLEFNGLRIKAIHASPSDELFGYLSREDATRLDMGGADLILLGHTHIAFEIRDDSHYLWVVSPGSVGMPKDGDPRASYAVLDTTKRNVSFGRARYDVELMLSHLRKLIGDDKPIFELLGKTFVTGE